VSIQPANLAKAVAYYRRKKDELLKQGYGPDIQYFVTIMEAGPSKIDSRFLLIECTWVAYGSSGGRGPSVRALDLKWRNLKSAFHGFNIESILSDQEGCVKRAFNVWQHRPKASWVVRNSHRIKQIEMGHGTVGEYLTGLRSRGLDVAEFELQGFMGIGPTNVRQLIKNLGLASVEKPDTQLIRLAGLYDMTPKTMTEGISKATRDSVGVVDTTLWLSVADKPSPGWTRRKHDP
jgi:hypothetical protein